VARVRSGDGRGDGGMWFSGGPTIVRVVDVGGAGHVINLAMVAWCRFWNEGELLRVTVRFPATEPVELEGEAAQAFLTAFQE
jgi:hypothetical protein